jgi:hypothetical protein
VAAASTPSSGTLQNFWDSREYVRYTYFTTVTREDVAKGQMGGGLNFRTGSGLPPGGGALFGPMPFPAILQQHLQNQLVRILWVQVPARLLGNSNSYLEFFRGRVNQKPFQLPGGPVWAPGSMLYLNYQPTFYLPPVPKVDLTGAYWDDQKWMDVELQFLVTNRQNADPLKGGVTKYQDPANPSWVQWGHNCEPWAGNLGSLAGVAVQVDGEGLSGQAVGHARGVAFGRELAGQGLGRHQPAPAPAGSDPGPGDARRYWQAALHSAGPSAMAR